MTPIPNWLTSQDSKLWFVLARLSAILGIITPLATIPVLITTGKSSPPAIILAVYVCVLASALLILLIRQEDRYFKEVKGYQSERDQYKRQMQYGPATMPMRSAFSHVAGASWNLFQGDNSQAAFRLGLQEALRYFAESFSLITGSTCRASIKLVQAASSGGDEHDLRVLTLCRDSDNSNSRARRADRILDNTDFKKILQEDNSYFICNDLPAQIGKGYRNSHWDERTIESGSFEYRATIVWPIERHEDAASREEPREIIGFLCIDTKTVGAFHETYDVALGAAFSQALHLALHRFREIEVVEHGAR